jgi:hypothetical protein
MIGASGYGSHIHYVRDVIDAPSRRAIIEDAGSIQWRDSASQPDSQKTRSVSRLNISLVGLDAGFAGVFAPRIEDACYVGLSSERVVIARYVEGDRFEVHTDAPYVRDRSTRSLFSILVYLNDDFAGGMTSFPDLRRNFNPEAGVALVFGHAHRHCGRPVTAGVKYVLHLFAMYAPADALDRAFGAPRAAIAAATQT